MKVSKEFIKREIAGEYILIPVGDAASKFVGLITINEIGSFIFDALSIDRELDDLVDLVLNEYESEKEIVYSDINDFLCELKKIGALIEK